MVVERRGARPDVLLKWIDSNAYRFVEVVLTGLGEDWKMLLTPALSSHRC